MAEETRSGPFDYRFEALLPRGRLIGWQLVESVVNRDRI
jgi:hypothetical protein